MPVDGRWDLTRRLKGERMNDAKSQERKLFQIPRHVK